MFHFFVKVFILIAFFSNVHNFYLPRETPVVDSFHSSLPALYYPNGLLRIVFINAIFNAPCMPSME